MAVALLWAGQRQPSRTSVGRLQSVRRYLYALLKPPPSHPTVLRLPAAYVMSDAETDAVATTPRAQYLSSTPDQQSPRDPLITGNWLMLLLVSYTLHPVMATASCLQSCPYPLHHCTSLLWGVQSQCCDNQLPVGLYSAVLSHTAALHAGNQQYG